MNRLITILLLSPLSVLMVLMGSAIGGMTGMVIALFLTLAMNYFSNRFSDLGFFVPVLRPVPCRYTTRHRR